MAGDVAPSTLWLLHESYSTWSTWAVLAMHSFHSASLAPELRHRFLIHYWATFFAAFGGSLISAFIIMRQDLAPLILFSSNYQALIWTAAWWLVNYCPFNLTGKLITFWPVMTIMKVGSSFLRVGTMTNRIDIAAKLYPGVVAPAILLGTIGGTGGKVLLDMIKYITGTLKGKHEMVVPGFPMRTAIAGTVLYYYFVYYALILSREEAIALLRTILIAHAILNGLTGMSLDLTQPAAAVVYRVSNLPIPDGTVHVQQSDHGEKHQPKTSVKRDPMEPKKEQ